MTIEAVEAVAGKAALRGVYPNVSPDLGRFRRTLEWDISGKCQQPKFVELYSRLNAAHSGRKSPMTVILEVRCRMCAWCLNQRRQFWAMRALDETKAAPRSWFATLTLEPHQHYEAECIARSENPNFDQLAQAQKFAALVQVVGRELTLFIKRVRKNSRARIRYLLVAEKHQSGRPHFHMLIHEQDKEAPVRKTVLKDAWKFGFSKFALVDDPSGAVYLCKYLSKDACTRVRASFKYGKSVGPVGDLPTNTFEEHNHF